jgi:NitT/TauT family transport system substrate-binding protein
MLEGFLPRDAIKTCLGPNGSVNIYIYRSLMNREVDATVVYEPYITVAEKAGCRVLCMASYHGTEVATDEVDDDAYARFTRAVSQAVRHINADKRKYMRYFIDYRKSDPEVAALTIDDFNLSRLQVTEPGPIPLDEPERTRRWMAGWDLLNVGTSAEKLVRPSAAHQPA